MTSLPGYPACTSYCVKRCYPVYPERQITRRLPFDTRRLRSSERISCYSFVKLVE